MVNQIAGNAHDFSAFRERVVVAHHSQYASNPHSKVRSEAAFNRMRDHIIKYYDGVKAVHSFQDSSGQIFDCVDRDKQPALLGTGKNLAAPPKLPVIDSVDKNQPTSPFKSKQVDPYGNKIECPQNCVALRRITLNELTRFETLDHFFRKSPKKAAKIVNDKFAKSSLTKPQQDGTPHEYAHAYQSVNNIGGHSFLNVWQLSIAQPEIFSLSQQWYVAENDGSLQTVEVGIQTFPGKYNHSNPVLFTYWTADGYNQTGAYNNDNKDFVLWGNSYSPGMALNAFSMANGQQVEIEVSYFLHDGNWWLFIGGTDENNAIGYYPASQYQNGPLETGATEIDFGGETVGEGLYPPMGSGKFAATGYKVAAYQRSIYYYDNGANVQQASLTQDQEWKASYTIVSASGPDWGESFYFGGPGGQGSPPS